jgi:hypothetical protein
MHFVTGSPEQLVCDCSLATTLQGLPQLDEGATTPRTPPGRPASAVRPSSASPLGQSMPPRCAVCLKESGKRDSSTEGGSAIDALHTELETLARRLEAAVSRLQSTSRHQYASDPAVHQALEDISAACAQLLQREHKLHSGTSGSIAPQKHERTDQGSSGAGTIQAAASGAPLHRQQSHQVHHSVSIGQGNAGEQGVAAERSNALPRTAGATHGSAFGSDDGADCASETAAGLDQGGALQAAASNVQPQNIPSRADQGDVHDVLDIGADLFAPADQQAAESEEDQPELESLDSQDITDEASQLVDGEELDAALDAAAASVLPDADQLGASHNEQVDAAQPASQAQEEEGDVDAETEVTRDFGNVTNWLATAETDAAPQEEYSVAVSSIGMGDEGMSVAMRTSDDSDSVALDTLLSQQDGRMVSTDLQAALDAATSVSPHDLEDVLAGEQAQEMPAMLTSHASGSQDVKPAAAEGDQIHSGQAATATATLDLEHSSSNLGRPALQSKRISNDQSDDAVMAEQAMDHSLTGLPAAATIAGDDAEEQAAARPELNGTSLQAQAELNQNDTFMSSSQVSGLEAELEQEVGKQERQCHWHASGLDHAGLGEITGVEPMPATAAQDMSGGTEMAAAGTAPEQRAPRRKTSGSSHAHPGSIATGASAEAETLYDELTAQLSGTATGMDDADQGEITSVQPMPPALETAPSSTNDAGAGEHAGGHEAQRRKTSGSFDAGHGSLAAGVSAEADALLDELTAQLSMQFRRGTKGSEGSAM